MDQDLVIYSNEEEIIEIKRERIYHFIYGGLGVAIGIISSSLFFLDILGKSNIISVGELFSIPLNLELLFFIGAFVLMSLSLIFLSVGITMTGFKIYKSGITFPRWRVKDIFNSKFIAFKDIKRIIIIKDYFITVELKNSKRRKLLNYNISDFLLGIEEFKFHLNNKVNIEEKD